MLDTAAYGEWNPFVERLESPQPPSEGDPIVLHVRWANGKTARSPERIVSIEPPQRGSRTAWRRRACPTSTRGCRRSSAWSRASGTSGCAGARRPDVVRHGRGVLGPAGALRRDRDGWPRGSRGTQRVSSGAPRSWLLADRTRAERAQPQPHRRVLHRPGQRGVAPGDPLEGAPADPRAGEQRVEGGRPPLEGDAGTPPPPPSRAPAGSRSPRRTPPAGWPVARAAMAPASAPDRTANEMPSRVHGSSRPAASPASRIRPRPSGTAGVRQRVRWPESCSTRCRSRPWARRKACR